ncbi:MAG TPA: response regulator [Actinomycetota bacterium]|nr:response regulator [Actinomycetota bacterium]
MDKQIRVLLADDTPDIRRLTRMMLDLDDRFVVVGEAADGVEAVEMAASQRPDAIILDIAMPVMDGLDAIPLILERAPGTRIVVLSAYPEQASREALARGAHAWVDKGSDFEELTDKLMETLTA